MSPSYLVCEACLAGMHDDCSERYESGSCACLTCSRRPDDDEGDE